MFYAMLCHLYNQGEKYGVYGYGRASLRHAIVVMCKKLIHVLFDRYMLGYYIIGLFILFSYKLIYILGHGDEAWCYMEAFTLLCDVCPECDIGHYNYVGDKEECARLVVTGFSLI